MPKFSQKPGFLAGWAIAQGLRNQVSSPNFGDDAKILAETRFLGLGRSRGGSETGFLTQNFGDDAKILAETQFLGRLSDRAGGSETGFLTQIGREDAKILAETRFLVFLVSWLGFFLFFKG